MLVTLKEVLKIAEEKKIAVGAFNAANLESLQAVLTAAEELHMPEIRMWCRDIRRAWQHKYFDYAKDDVWSGN